jgi:ParB family chromosome partitioning protein
VAVWKGLPEYSRSAGAIKRKLTETEVNAADPRVKLVTLARYEASGGTTRKDLFTDEVFLDDPGLVDLLVAEVLIERADAVRTEGWAWVEIIEQMGYEEQQRFREPPVRYLAESDAACVEREALEAKLDALEEKYHDGTDSDDESEEAMSILEAINTECDVIRGELEASRRARIDTSGYDKAQLGAVVTTQAGSIQVRRGLMTAEAARAATQSNDHAGRGEGSGVLAGGKSLPEEFSERLMADLTSHRTAAMQAALIGNAQVALAVLAHGMASDLFGRQRGAGGNPAQVTVKGCRAGLERDATNFGESAAAKVLDAERDRWESLLPEDANDWLSWLIAQPQATVLSLLAYCTAQSVDLVQRRSRANVQADAIANALSLDLADWWTPCADNFLSHVPKAKIIEAVTAAVGEGAAKDLPKMKKTEAVAAGAALLAGTRWLPTPLRVASVADAASTD